MDQFLDQFFNLEIMAKAGPIVLRGFGMTLLLCLAVIPSGLVAGLAVALLSIARRRTVRWPILVFVDFFRAVPPLVLLIFVYSGLPFAGLRPSPFAAVCIAFLLNNGAYYGEIFRAGIDSIGTGQWEAARSSGLGHGQTLLYVVLPQSTRNVLPDLISNTVEVVKLTSLASAVALPELLYSADMARSVTYNSSPIMLAAGIYLLMLWPCVRLLSRLQHRMGT